MVLSNPKNAARVIGRQRQQIDNLKQQNIDLRDSLKSVERQLHKSKNRKRQSLDNEQRARRSQLLATLRTKVGVSAESVPVAIATVGELLGVDVDEADLISSSTALSDCRIAGQVLANRVQLRPIRGPRESVRTKKVIFFFFRTFFFFFLKLFRALWAWCKR